MEPLTTFNRYMDRARDPHRVRNFSRFVGARLWEDNLFQSAGALAYTTIFAVMPLTLVVFSVVSAFSGLGSPNNPDGQSDLGRQLSNYIFSNFVPEAARSVETELFDLVDKVQKLTITGAVALIVSLLITLNSVETTFNRIWRVKHTRPQVSRFLVYWTVLTLGALIAAASLAVSAQLFANALFDTQPGRWLESILLRLGPVVIELVAFTAIYRVVPHRTVHWRHAIAGAALATLLFEAMKWGLGLYLTNFGSYSKIYGTLALLPIFLVWIYLSWLAVLLGASLASALSAYRYQPASMRLPEGYEIYGLFRLLARFHEVRRSGNGLHLEDIQRLEPMLTDGLAQQLLAQLCEINVTRRAENGEWVLTRDLDDLSLGELYEACQLRIPIAEAHLPCRDDAIGHASMAVLDELRVPLRDLLKRRVSTLHAEGDA